MPKSTQFNEIESFDLKSPDCLSDEQQNRELLIYKKIIEILEIVKDEECINEKVCKLEDHIKNNFFSRMQKFLLEKKTRFDDKRFM